MELCKQVDFYNNIFCVMSTRPGRGRGRGAKSTPPASIEGGANEDRDKGRG